MRTCHNFVDGMLEVLRVPRIWRRNGVIYPFVKGMTNVDRSNFKLQFYDEEYFITCHSDLKDYWNKIQDKLKEEKGTKEDTGKDEVRAMEIVDLIKGLERGYISKLEVDPSEYINFQGWYGEDGKFSFGNGISYAFGSFDVPLGQTLIVDDDD